MSAMETPQRHELRQTPEAREAAMGEAKLDGVAGRGTLQVRRGRRGEYVASQGTWRPTVSDADVERLVTAAGSERTLRYEGPVEDPNAPERPNGSVEVRVTSHADYEYSEAPDGESAPGGTRHVFNFRPTDASALPTT